MKITENTVIIFLAIIFVILCAYIFRKKQKEGWYNNYYSTYVNTPSKYGIYPNYPSFSPYLGYNPYGPYHTFSTTKSYKPYNLSPYYQPYSRYGAYIKPKLNYSVTPYNYYNPTPMPRQTIFNKPMLTSVEESYPLGTWSHIGVGYPLNNRNNFNDYVQIYQLNLDPDREFYQYKIITKDGLEIPLSNNLTLLEDRQRFKIKGQNKIYVADLDKYDYVYI